jgi:hypothetical protein
MPDDSNRATLMETLLRRWLERTAPRLPDDPPAETEIEDAP